MIITLMRILRYIITGTASLVGLGIVLAFKPTKSCTRTVYVIYDPSTETYNYTKSTPGISYQCVEREQDACTVTTTIPVGMLNTFFVSDLPNEKLTPGGYIKYLSPGTVYVSEFNR